MCRSHDNLIPGTRKSRSRRSIVDDRLRCLFWYSPIETVRCGFLPNATKHCLTQLLNTRSLLNPGGGQGVMRSNRTFRLPDEDADRTDGTI